MPEWILPFYVQQTFACVDPGLNGEVDMTWMMELASSIFLTDVILLFSKSVHFNATIIYIIIIINYI